jgi:hypothetical protein
MSAQDMASLQLHSGVYGKLSGPQAVLLVEGLLVEACVVQPVAGCGVRFG